ncbi:hypothetical protein [Methyloversatilis discipulorum]|uniref:hypothetical protein n=1 Tax=Methyloversatilis discipulorum TaxID=1119528 RepID=UPI001A417459|nr:hypothetical protein [Methyloversatilis discipulorum]MBL8469677.1 hypothetical protein [Methyloversatilis discipulorum]
MTTSEQPEALRLADWLQANYEADGVDEAAAELRRQHALLGEMAGAMQGVIRVADRATLEFDRAKAAIAKWEASK